MNYPNGTTVADVKKSVSSTASKIGGTIKSETQDLKSEAKKATSELESSDAVNETKSLTKSVLSSALALLPVKNADKALSMLESTVKDVQSGLVSARDSATSFVKKYPLYSLLGAAVIGASAAMLITMRKSSDSMKYDA